MITSSLPVDELTNHSYARFSNIVGEMRGYTGFSGLFKSKYCFTSESIIERSIDFRKTNPDLDVDAITISVWKACKGRLSDSENLTENSYITAKFIDEYLSPLIPNFPFPETSSILGQITIIVLGMFIEFPCRLIITLILQGGLFLYRAINLDEARYYEVRLWSNLYPKALKLLSL